MSLSGRFQLPIPSICPCRSIRHAGNWKAVNANTDYSPVDRLEFESSAIGSSISNSCDGFQRRDRSEGKHPIVIIYGIFLVCPLGIINPVLTICDHEAKIVSAIYRQVQIV